LLLNNPIIENSKLTVLDYCVPADFLITKSETILLSTMREKCAEDENVYDVMVTADLKVVPLAILFLTIFLEKESELF
jgi:flavoprotein